MTDIYIERAYSIIMEACGHEENWSSYDKAVMDVVREAAAEIERLRAAVAAEREACARLAEKVWFDAHDTEWDGGVECAKGKIAFAIRARGEE